ncbi:hypothetical protein [Streptomyces sp. AF1B]|jgi:hypothetical protein|uniref:hypothetical protein n=1 Tax=Streptomyces sp. AF1B TaxID=3399503 RepID=UPI003AAD82F2
MRSTARVLSVAALASATLGFAASAALADPAAEVSPSTVAPGGSVTVSVTCESTGGEAPATIDATSEAFDEGTVKLQRVPGDDKGASTSYRGTARVSGTDDLAGDTPDEAAPDEAAPGGAAPDGAVPGQDAQGAQNAEAAQDVAWTVEGTCPGAPGGKGKEWSATFHGGHGDGSDGDGGDGAGEVPGGPSHVPGGPSDVPGKPSEVPGGRGDVTGGGGGGGGGPVEHGVQAGEGGAFTDSVPALVAGGLLIAGALGGAAYRVWHKRSVLRG